MQNEYIDKGLIAFYFYENNIFVSENLFQSLDKNGIYTNL